MKLIKTAHIFTDGPTLDFDSLSRINLEHKSGIEKFFVKKGDIFFVRSYGTRRGVGYVSMAPHSDDTTVHGGFIIRYRITNPKANPLFLTYLLRTKEYRQKITTTSGGTQINNVNQEVLGRLVINLPTYNEQKVISNILWEFDHLIETNNRRIRLLERMARTLYREWFVHYRFPEHENVELVDSELGKIPDGWKIEKLSELVSTQYGFTESAKEEKVGPKFVRGTDINKRSYIVWDDVPFCPIEEKKYGKYRLKKNDILIIRMANPGKVGIIEKDIDSVFASYLIRLGVVNDAITPYFLFYTLTGKRYQDFISGASTGTTRKSASATVITSYNMIVPLRAIMEKFENNTKCIRHQLSALVDQNSILQQSRDIILPRLVSGSINVSNLEIEMPKDTQNTSKSTTQSTLDQWLDYDRE